MAQCKWCGNKGLFLKVSKDGLCKTCTYTIIPEAESKLRVINDSGSIILKSKNIDTIASRTEISINHLDDLKKYEEKGIPILTQPIGSMIIEFANTSNERITELIKLNVSSVKEKLRTIKSETTKSSQIRKIIEKATTQKNKLNRNGQNFMECSRLIDQYIGEIQKV
jgi:hypothetical protein